MRTLALLSLLALVPIASAQEASVRPVDPTSAEPVSILATYSMTCAPPPKAAISGFTIVLTLDPGPCLSPPVNGTRSIPLGKLLPGTYTVTTVDRPEIVLTTFSVRDANGSVLVRPAIGKTAGGETVDVIADVGHCGSAACPPPLVTFNGLLATSVSVVNATTFRVTTPPHRAASVEVVVTSATATRRSFAFRYYDPAAPLAPELFERVLVPVFYNGPGVNGSRWSTEFAMWNLSDARIELVRGADAVTSIAPGATQRAGFANAANGAFLLVARGAAERMRFNAMIRDVSRDFEAWGTELPVVREGEFSRDVALLNAPAYPGFRTMLRIYGLDASTDFVNVTVTSMDDGRTLSSHDYRLQSPAPCTAAIDCLSDRPSYLALPAFTESLPAALPQERLAIRVRSITPVWAFLTVTNNDSQHVAVISPQ